MFKRFCVLFAIVLLISVTGYGQSYSGPADGAVNGGVIVSTNNFTSAPSFGSPMDDIIRNKIDVGLLNVRAENLPEIDASQFYQADPYYSADNNPAPNLLLKSFAGLTQSNSIPADPYVAVGAGYIVATINSDFGIYDMNGNLLKRINADAWYSSTINSPGAFDPKVTYDHEAKRWVMVWLDQDDALQRGNFLISVSLDSIPLGQWINYVLPSNVNGTTQSGGWVDFQGVGIDENAVYIVGNQFSFASSFQYAKIRIVNKADLYRTTPGAVRWSDIWNIKYPPGVASSSNVFHIKPMLKYGTTTNGRFYLVHTPNGSANFVAIYWIDNPINNPTLTGQIVGIGSYSPPPNANQLGGGSPLISTNGAQMQIEPIYKDGRLYIIHSIANPQNFGYSALQYVRINTTNMVKEEEIIFGSVGAWYFFPSLAVDRHGNVGISYSRSADEEYVGAFYASKKAAENVFSPSLELKKGVANYVKTFGGTRNRWGDYSGIWLDPRNDEDFVIFNKWVSAVNTWNTWGGIFRVAPYDGPRAVSLISSLNFNDIEVGTESAPLEFELISYGSQPLVISNMNFVSNNFQLITNLTYPFNLPSGESITVQMRATPGVAGNLIDTLFVSSNDGGFIGVEVKTLGYVINPASFNTMYASSGVTNSGNLATINTASGSGTTVGPTGFNNILSVVTNKTNGELIGLTGPNPASIVRINAGGTGNAHNYMTLTDITDAASISFDTSGVLYMATRSGGIYTVDLGSKTFTQVATSPALIQSIAFDPLTNELYASLYKAIGGGKDILFKINAATGDTTNVGAAGFSTFLINDLEFTSDGTLYALKGNAAQVSELYTLSTTNGTGTLVAATGVVGLTSLGFNPLIDPTSVKDISVVPSAYSVSQNYPNPFNPVTTIEFSVPVPADITINVYNVLGEIVRTIYSGFNNSGTYTITWNSTDATGNSVPSGIYFYEMKAKGVDNTEFSKIQKMVLMK